MPTPTGYALKFPPGAQKEIQLEAEAPEKALAPGIPVSPKHGQPSPGFCASISLVALTLAAGTLYKIPW